MSAWHNCSYCFAAYLNERVPDMTYCGFARACNVRMKLYQDTVAANTIPALGQKRPIGSHLLYRTRWL